MQRRLSLVAHHGLNRLAAREHAWLERLNGVRLPDWENALALCLEQNLPQSTT